MALSPIGNAILSPRRRNAFTSHTRSQTTVLSQQSDLEGLLNCPSPSRAAFCDVGNDLGRPYTRIFRNQRKIIDHKQHVNFSLLDDLTHMTSKPFAATQGVVDTIQRFATTACTARRNCQTLFTLISTARDVCHNINNLIHQFDDAELPKDTRWDAFDRYNRMLDTLESVLEDCDSIPADESAAFNPDFRSWTKNREMLRRSITTLRVLTSKIMGLSS
ncbi:hypothetical protein FRB95_000349 [Tulasnella sp. JGI-2019a]|nr:hypothetical protein FRB95_000349 [Tulasnella sp. JGI-2019a]